VAAARRLTVGISEVDGASEEVEAVVQLADARAGPSAPPSPRARAVVPGPQLRLGRVRQSDERPRQDAPVAGLGAVRHLVVHHHVHSARHTPRRDLVGVRLHPHPPVASPLLIYDKLLSHLFPF
jgi:hypothetical protein